MIGFLRGVIADFSENSLTMDVGGVGFELCVSASTLSSVKLGEKTTLLTHMTVREDAMTLYGFYSGIEKEMFLKLISVSGIGAKSAIAILSSIRADELAGAIASGDSARLNCVKGVGKKTAERIVLELKDKLGGVDFVQVGAGSLAPKASEAVAALLSMGFSRQEASAAVAGVKNTDNLTTEEIIIASLKNR